MATVKISDLKSFKPLEWDNMAGSVIPWTDTSTITADTWHPSVPGELLDYNFEYDIDFLKASGLPPHEQEKIFKKELAQKLVEQMIEDGHIVFTKQTFAERHAIRFKAYTWVGNKDFIEQQRKAKSRGIR